MRCPISRIPDPSDAIYVHDVPAERAWSRLLKRGQTLRIVDSEGQQAVDALLYCARTAPSATARRTRCGSRARPYVGQGTRLISNKGRVMARITADTCGQHGHLGRMLLLREQRRPLR